MHIAVVGRMGRCATEATLGIIVIHFRVRDHHRTRFHSMTREKVVSHVPVMFLANISPSHSVSSFRDSCPCLKYRFVPNP